MSYPFKQEMIKNYDFKPYRKIEAMNKSLLSHALKSMAHFHEQQINPPAISPITQHNFDMGHCAEYLLTGGQKEFNKHAIVAGEKINKATKAGKAMYAGLLEYANGRIILSPDDYEKIQGMVNTALAHPVVKKYLVDQEYDTSVAVTGIDPDSGEPIKGLIDVLPRSGKVAIDIKTTIDASPSGAVRAISKFTYFLQAAMYTDLLHMNGVNIKEFVFIFCEKSSPYAVGVYTLSSESIEQGRRDYKRLLKAYSECKKSDYWPAYSDYIEEIALPLWCMDDEPVTLGGVAI